MVLLMALPRLVSSQQASFLNILAIVHKLPLHTKTEIHSEGELLLTCLHSSRGVVNGQCSLVGLTQH